MVHVNNNKKPLLLLLIMTFTAIMHAQQTTAKQPNIIFLMADDLGYGDVGCYGQQKIETPAIDRMAANGLRFIQFYAGSTVCAPSRTSLMTGMHTGHTVIRGNKTFKPEGQTPLPDSVTTFANILQQHGYVTAAFGKWSLGFITTSGDPAKKGFDKFVGYNCQTLAHNYYPDHLWDNHTRLDFPENADSNDVYSADFIHHAAMQFLKEKHDKPFFMYLPYTLPHADLILPHDSVYYYYVRKFNEQPRSVPAVTNGKEHHRFEPYPHATYAAMVSRLDRFVGEIIQALEEQGLAENTLFIFTSDNGPHREDGGDPDYFKGSGIFRGIKRDLYEGGIREPFIAYWPGKIKPGTSKTVAALWDMYPTFLEVAGIPVTKHIDGVSILPALVKQKEMKPHQYLYWEFHENDGRQAVLWNNWKGIRLGVSKDNNAPVELYNLQKDPSERDDVSAKYPDIVKKIRQLMKEGHVRNPDWPFLPGE